MVAGVRQHRHGIRRTGKSGARMLDRVVRKTGAGLIHVAKDQAKPTVVVVDTKLVHHPIGRTAECGTVAAIISDIERPEICRYAGSRCKDTLNRPDAIHVDAQEI